MTKTLTEQWREGKIKEGFYYVHFYTGEIVYRHLSGNKPDKEFIKLGCFQEILAPVPSYKDYNKLRKLPLKCFQLEEDNSALMVINKDMCKEIERLQEQLNEANEVIKKYMSVAFEIRSEEEKPTVLQLAFNYLEKFGVK